MTKRYIKRSLLFLMAFQIIIGQSKNHGFLFESEQSYSQSTTSVSAGNTFDKLSVTRLGAAVYTIPFLLPPGIKGTSPKIGLTYNSKKGNGIAGWGWNISGLSTITRTLSTKFYDDILDGFTDILDPMDGNILDHFALDGQKLVLISGTHGAEGSVYTTEKQSNIRIKARGSYSENAGLRYFEVFYPDGSFALYGYQNSYSPVEWAIREWRDPQGNFIKYDYILEENTLRITSISYGSNGETESPNKINFHYKKRIRPEMVLMNDEKLLRTNILSYVNIRGKGNALYRQYKLFHFQTSLGYESVERVQEYNGTGEAMPAIEFKYEDGQEDEGVDFRKTEINFNIFSEAFELFRELNTNIIDPSSRKVFDARTMVHLSHDLQIVDNKIIYNKAILFESKFYNEEKYNEYNIEWPIGNEVETNGLKFIKGDFNGDGLIDILGVFPNQTVYFIDLDTRKSNDFLTRSGSLKIKIDFEKPQKFLGSDFNGNGKTDLFHFSNGEVCVYELTESNKLVLLYQLSDNAINLDFPILFGDYNGDGKPDFLTPMDYETNDWKFFYSNGKSFNSLTKTISIQHTEYFSNYEITELNGDGKTDIIYTHLLEKIYLENTISSNGYANFKISNPSAIKNHKKETVLSEIHNNGIIQSIKYSESSYGFDEDFLNQEEQYPYVNVDLTKDYQVVIQIEETSKDITRYQDFRYKGAVSHVKSLDVLRFNCTARSNIYNEVDNGINSVYPIWIISKHDTKKHGAITEQLTSNLLYYDLDDYKIKKTIIAYQTSLSEDKVFVNLPTQIVTTDFLQGTTITKSFEYDDYYNITKSKTQFSGGSNIVETQYSNNPSLGSYYIGLPTYKKKTKVLGGELFSTETQYKYSGNLLTSMRSKTMDSDWLTENYEYDTYGNITNRIISGSGIASRSMFFKYSEDGRFLTKLTNTEGLTTRFTHNGITGNILTISNPYKQITSFKYNGWNKIVAKSDYLNNVTKYSYERYNDYGMKTETQYPGGSKAREYTNPFGWITKSERLNISGKWIKKNFKYDVTGKTIKESAPYYDNPSKWDKMNYDIYGRPYHHSFWYGGYFAMTYNGLSVIINSPEKTTTFTKDALGNIIQVKDPGGTINYAYYANGVIKSANYSDYAVTTKIDEWGRKKELNDPSAGNYTYQYNILGKTTKETTPKGYTEYAYDAIGKVTRKKISGDQTDLTLDYVYDDETKLLTNINGVDAINNSNYTYTYTYDQYKRLQSISENIGVAQFSKHWTYDEFGRQQTEEIGSQIIGGMSSTVQTDYVYGNSGVLREVRDGNKTLWKLKKSNNRGQPTLISLGNGHKKHLTYDEFGYIQHILHDNPNGKTVLDLSYIRNRALGLLNNRKRQGINNEFYKRDFSEDFSYDIFSRLTSINTISTKIKNSDSINNILNKRLSKLKGLKNISQGFDIRYDSINKTQIYKSDGRITENSNLGKYNYDSASKYRLATIDLNKQGLTYYRNHSKQDITYNAFKKPVEIYEKGHGRVSFQYGPLMGRSHAYYGGEQENKLERRYRKYYSSIAPIEIIQDTKTGRDKIVTYLYGGPYDAPVVHIKQTGNDGEFYYLHRDYLGSILAITNSFGDLVEQRQFDAWGVVDYFSKGLQASEFNHENSLLARGYTGHEHFFGVSLIHMNGRMYDQNIGRFLSPDDYIQEPFNTQSYNRYSYALNNPLMYVDLDGRSPWDVIFNSIDEDGNKTELGRIVTDKFDQEININQNLIPFYIPKNYKPVNVNLYANETPSNVLENKGIQAISLDVSGEAAFKVGVQLEVSLIGIVAGINKGDWGVALQANGLVGLEASVTASASAYWSITGDDLSLKSLSGFEYGAQGSVFGASGAYFEGIKFTTSYPFAKRVYGGASLGGSLGIPELGGSASGYIGVSEFLYMLNK